MHRFLARMLNWINYHIKDVYGETGDTIYAHTENCLYIILYSNVHNYWFVRYRLEAYLSSKLRTQKSLCGFDTKEEAQSICERHHKLLLLQ